MGVVSFRWKRAESVAFQTLSHLRKVKSILCKQSVIMVFLFVVFLSWIVFIAQMNSAFLYNYCFYIVYSIAMVY